MISLMINKWISEFLGTFGLGLLFAASTLFIGLLIYLILQPFLSDVLFAWVDFLVVLLMSLICFVPFGLYVRAIRSSISNEVGE